MTENKAKYSSTSPVPEADFFSTPAISGLISQVIQLVRYGDGLPLIYGESQSGKTTIAKEIESQLEMDGFTVKLNAAQFEDDFSGLLLSILGSFGHSSEANSASNVGDLLSQLRHFSQSLYESKKQAVAIIDDANALDDMSVGALLSLIQGQESGGFGLHFIFLATKTLIDRVDALQMLDVAVYDLPVPHLSLSELEEFLQFLSTNAVAVSSEVNTSSLWSSTGGLLGSIVQQVKQDDHKIPALVSNVASAEGRTAFSWVRSFPVYHVAAIVVLVFVLLWVFLFNGSGKSSQIVKPVALGVGETQAPQAEKPSLTTVLENPVKTLEAQKDLPVEVTKQPLYSQFDVAEKTTTTPKPELSENKDVLPIKAPDKLESVPLVLAPQAESVVRQPLPSATSNVPASGIKPSEDAVRFASVKTPKLRQILIDSEAYIQLQKPSFSTLQVLAVSKEGALLDFINSQPNKAALRVYRGVRSGKNFFIVITGAYADKTRARASILDLPLKQRQAKPWVRSYQSVQTDMINQ